MVCIFVDNKDIDASSMRVETLNGTIMLSDFDKNAAEMEKWARPRPSRSRSTGGSQAAVATDNSARS